MPRPRKSEAEKLVPVTTNLPRPTFDAACHEARRQGTSVAQLLRSAVERGMRREDGKTLGK